MLIRAFAYVYKDLPDWKLQLVGNVTDSFLAFLQVIFEKYPGIDNKVIISGPIADNKELMTIYKTAKIFALTFIKELSDKRIIPIYINFNDILLPENKFDIIVVDDVNNYSMWVEMIETLITSSRENGILISYTDNNDISVSIKEIFSNIVDYTISQDRYLQEIVVDISIKENIKSNTSEHAALSVKNIKDSFKKLNKRII